MVVNAIFNNISVI